MQWYLKVIKNYVNFQDRARRKEYWIFLLINLIIISILSGLASQVSFFYFLSSIYGLFVFLPGLAVAIRRLHDIGKSGLWLLIGLIPAIGGIWLLILMCQAGDVGNNTYGADPKTEG